MRKAIPVLALLLSGCAAFGTMHRRPAMGGRSPEHAPSPDQLLVKELACAIKNEMTPDAVVTRLDTLPAYMPDSTGKAGAVSADSVEKTRTSESATNHALDTACRSSTVKAPIPVSVPASPSIPSSGKPPRTEG